ncbi:MAG: protein kinase [Candidatus Krumholzibacteria bacterium]|nr:protein kinase [Candidatus Krumholzibacteria bacterium]
MIGETISHYEIIEKIGEGGVGKIYRAKDLRLKRDVALKFLKPEFLISNEDRNRFVHEAQAAAVVQHPHICPVYEIGRVGDLTFIAMAYVEGETLHDRIERGPLEIADAVEFTLQMARGLKAAHDKGIVHRDIKSSNAIVTTEGQIQITDFGLALQRGVTRLTRPGTMLPGTLLYMSPEHASSDELDHRSDIWSLGVVLYEMVTGSLPFVGETEPRLIYSILHDDPTPAGELRDDVPADLDAVIARTLAKKPADRYRSADELVADLRQIQQDVAGGSTGTARRRVGIRHHRWFKSRLVWIVLTVAASVAVTIQLYPSATVPFSQRDWILITDFDNQTGEDVFKGIVHQALTIDLQQSPYVNVFPRQRAFGTIERMGRAAVTEIGEEVGCEIAVREGINAVLIGGISKIGESYFLSAQIVNPSTREAVKTERVEAGSPDDVLGAIDLLSRQVRKNLGESLSSIESLDEPLAKVTTSSLSALKFYSLASQHALKARYNDAIPLLEQAVREDPWFAMAHSKLAVIHNNLGNSKEALDCSRRAVEGTARVTERERYYIEAQDHVYRGDLNRAIAKFRLLTELYPDDFHGQNNLSFYYQFTRQYEEARKRCDEAMRIAPDSWFPHHNRAGILGGLGNYEEAIESERVALKINPAGYWSYITLGWNLLCWGDTEGAFAALHNVPATGSGWQSLRTLYMASLLRYLGRDGEAIETLREGISEDAEGARDVQRSTKMVNLSEVLLENGSHSQALRSAQAAVAVSEDSEALLALGLCYARTAQTGLAEKTLADLGRLVQVERTKGDLARLERLKGEIAMAKGSYADAGRDLRTSLSIRDFLGTRFSLAACYSQLQQYGHAVDEYNYIIRNQYSTFFENTPWLWPLSHYLLGTVYEELGEPNKSTALYEKFLELWKNADKNKREIADARARLNRLQDF